MHPAVESPRKPESLVAVSLVAVSRAAVSLVAVSLVAVSLVAVVRAAEPWVARSLTLHKLVVLLRR